MTKKEDQGYYYSFSLDESFVPTDIEPEWARRNWLLNHTHIRLNIFIDLHMHDILKPESKVDGVFILSQDKDKLDEVKKFCNYLYEGNVFSTLAINHLKGKFDLDGYDSELVKMYEYYKLNESVNAKSGNAKVTKRPKV